MSLTSVLREIFTNPTDLLLRRWNWKAALFSSFFRSIIFLIANLAAGWRAATAAMVAEFLFRAATAGFYGALTQAFCRVEPAWKAGMAAMFFVPLISHSLEFGLHYMRGTPRLFTSIISSMVFTMLSTLFNVYAMRRGALLVCPDARPAVSDLRRIPQLLGGFLAAGPVALYGWARQLSKAVSFVR